MFKEHKGQITVDGLKEQKYLKDLNDTVCKVPRAVSTIFTKDDFKENGLCQLLKENPTLHRS